MSLSCSCYDDDADWYYNIPSDFSILDTKKRKKCCSCQNLIDIGSYCLKFNRWRPARTDIEDRILGDEVPLAPWYMCESCGEIFLNLDAIGYCILLGEDMNYLMKEYHELTGFKKEIINNE